MASETGAIVVRVFPAAPEGGNPAPIMLEASEMTAADIQDVARRYGHKSGFVVAKDPGSDADFRFRYFVPNHEMEMCGHATIGALWLLREAGRIENPEVGIDTLSGRIDAVVPASGPIAVSQPAGVVEPLSSAQTALVCGVLGIAFEDLSEPDAVNARTSRTKTLLPLKSADRLHTLAPRFDAIERICEEIGSTGLYPFAPGMGERVVHARQFPKSSGYPEDAATGIAASALAFGLLHWERAAATDTVTVRQGEAMGRASEISIRFRSGETGVDGCWIVGTCAVDG